MNNIDKNLASKLTIRTDSLNHQNYGLAFWCLLNCLTN